jgi:Protein of unknown function (DUF1194)
MALKLADGRLRERQREAGLGLLCRLLIAVAFAFAAATGAHAAETPVSTALVLLVDVSGSIHSSEYELQRDGIAHAFRDPNVLKAISNQPYGGLAVTLVEWSTTQAVVVPWTIVHDEATARAFADAVTRAPRSSEGATHIGDAIMYALTIFDTSPSRPGRRVIDISGDGKNNGGRIPVDQARDAALELGVTINGLAIVDRLEQNLVEHYREYVIGGAGSFVTEANGFADFARALRHKLVLEIADAAR